MKFVFLWISTICSVVFMTADVAGAWSIAEVVANFSLGIKTTESSEHSKLSVTESILDTKHLTGGKVLIDDLLVTPKAAVHNPNRPPMGWRSWNLFGANVDQELMEKTMDGMVNRKLPVLIHNFSTGMSTRKGNLGEKDLTFFSSFSSEAEALDFSPHNLVYKNLSLADLGYTDIGLDDNWQHCAKWYEFWKIRNYHDSTGKPIVNKELFPDLKKMTDRAHSLNLTIGWYGNNCLCREHWPASESMYEQDARATVFEYGFDSTKLDGCGTQMDLDLWGFFFQKYTFSNSLSEMKTKVMIENCHWGWSYIPISSNDSCPFSYYRSSIDIRPEYDSVLHNLQTTLDLAKRNLSFPGCWAYPDMLEVATFNTWEHNTKTMSFEEQRAHFGAWCVISSPLILGHDVWEDFDNDSIEDDGAVNGRSPNIGKFPNKQRLWSDVIANTDAIAVNQNYFGFSGGVFKESKGVLRTKWQFLYKPLSWDGSRTAILFLNHERGLVDGVELDVREVPGFMAQSALTSCEPSGNNYKTCTKKFAVYDIWQRKTWNFSDFVCAGKMEKDNHDYLLPLKKVGGHDSVFLILSSADSSDCDGEERGDSGTDVQDNMVENQV